jgi:hypothetical protein
VNGPRLASASQTVSVILGKRERPATMSNNQPGQPAAGQYDSFPILPEGGARSRTLPQRLLILAAAVRPAESRGSGGLLT